MSDPRTTTDAGATMPEEKKSSPDGSFRYRLERREGSTVRIEVDVDAARLRAAADRQFERHNRQASIPGFRAGKAPRAIYERHYGTQHLWNESADEIIDETYREIAQTERIEPLDQPSVEIGAFSPDQDLSYVATVAVKPEVALGDYTAHGATVQPTGPTDEAVERVIAGMREHHAELRPVDRPAQDGDIVTVDIDVDLRPAGEGGEPRKLTLARNGHLELGRDYAVPGLSQGLVGVRSGDERTLELTFPDDADEDLRGRSGAFTVRTSAVAEKVLPPLDEGFAKTVGVADTTALRKTVRDELAHGAFHEARDAAADTAIAHAVETSRVEVPDILVQDEIDHMVADLKRQVTERGLTWERFLLQAKKTEAEIRGDWREAAQRRAKSLLVLDAIAEREGVTVSSAELAQEVALTPLAQQDPKALRSPQVLAAMARSMRNRKVVDTLIGLGTPEAEREILKGLGTDVDPHGEALVAATADAADAAEHPAGSEPAAPALVVPERSGGTAEGREAIRALLEKKD